MPFPESVPADFDGGFAFSPPWETPVRFSPTPLQLQPPNPAQQAQTPPAATPRSTVTDELSSDRAEERRIRRKISNRESARRSRVRKQRRLEDLRAQLSQLNSDHRELADRLVAVTGQCLFFCRDNDRLRSEAAGLRRRLRGALIFRLLQFRLGGPSPPPPPPPMPPQVLLEQVPVYGVGS